VSQGSGGVSIFGTSAPIETWSDTEIEFTMPNGVPSDVQISITVTNNDGGMASTQYDITPPNVIRITADNDMDHYPCWSSGGAYIYFCTTRFEPTNWDIARIPFGGGAIQRATNYEGPDFFPDIRHSSGELAWSSTRDHLGYNTEGDYEIFTGFRSFQPGGFSTTGIDTQNESRDLDPAWAQTVHAGYDMTWTYEVVDQAGNFIKWMVMRHGQGSIEEVTEGQHPNFSPNGQWIVYSHQGDLYKIETTGDTPVQLTDTGYDTYPHWGSNDRIVFQRYVSGTAEDLYVMNSDGTDVQELIATRSREYHPTWSPDASKVVYYAHRGSLYDIYVIVVP
jgi:Tol biopolymer transport system component